VADYAATGRPVGIEITAPRAAPLERLNNPLAELGLAPLAERRFVTWKAFPGWRSTLSTITVPEVKVERSLASHRRSYPSYQAKKGSVSIVLVAGS
jgi:hypothetical protein